MVVSYVVVNWTNRSPPPPASAFSQPPVAPALPSYPTPPNSTQMPISSQHPSFNSRLVTVVLRSWTSTLQYCVGTAQKRVMQLSIARQGHTPRPQLCEAAPVYLCPSKGIIPTCLSYWRRETRFFGGVILMPTNFADPCAQFSLRH